VTRCAAAIPGYGSGCPLEVRHAGKCVAQSEIDFYGSVEKAQRHRMTNAERAAYDLEVETRAAEHDAAAEEAYELAGGLL